MRTRLPSCVAVLSSNWSTSPGLARPRTAVPIAAELDADGPIGVVELGLFGGGEIPIPDDVEIRRGLVDDGTPFPLEIEPGRRPDLGRPGHADYPSWPQPVVVYCPTS